MATIRGLALCCLVGLATAQYGPPKQTGPIKHRTTTTTQVPPSANEIFPESGDSAYQPSPGYQPQPQNAPKPGPPSSYGVQPGLVMPGPQPSYPAQPGPPKSGYQPSPPPPPGSVSVMPVDISNNPFINAGISGKPVSSGTYQPQPGQQPAPVYPSQPAQPGYPSQPQPAPAPVPAPQPSYPAQPAPQPGYPSQPVPAPAPVAPVMKPINIQGNPFLSGAMKPQRPPQQPQSGYGPQQPVPQPPPFSPQPGAPPQQPQPGYGPQQPQQPIPQPPPFRPQQPQPGSQSPQQPQPGYGPQQQPQQPIPQQPPFRPQPQPGQPQRPTQGYGPQQQPQQPIPQPPPFRPQQPQPGSQSPQKPQPGYVPQQQPQQPIPQQPPFRPQPQPGQPQRPTPGYGPQQPQQQPQQPIPDDSQYKPVQVNPPVYQRGRPGLPNQFPGQQPNQPGPQPPQPGYPNQQPYTPNQPSQPAPYCSGPGSFCVASSSCYNGIITGNGAPESIYKSGQCAPDGQVCCKAPVQPQPYNNPAVQPATEAPVNKYTGPLNTEIPKECAAALKCVPESYCDEMGVMRDAPVALTREQQENKVPLSDCLNTETGVYGKCCRDPNYKDPWPAGMMMAKSPDSQGFDDGQYKPGKYPGEPAQPGTPQVSDYGQVQQPYYAPGSPPTIAPPNPYTIKKPLGVFGGAVTPFPVAPKPGQTREDVFPQNEDKLAAPAYPQTAGPQPHPVGAPYQTPVSPSGPTSPYGPSSVAPSGSGSDQSPIVFPGQPNPSGPTALPGVYRQPPPGFQGPPGPAQTAPGYGSPQPQPQPDITPGQQCGVRRPAPPTKPDETGFGEFPWHAVIQSANNKSSICSAVIIAPNAVLTAAHCVQGIRPEDMVVTAGEWTLGQPGPKPAQSRVAGATAVHPVFNAGSLVKDQAIVVTEVPFQFDQHVDKVCLPSGSGDYVPKTSSCYLTGFGRPNLQNNAPGSVLHKIPVTIVPKDQCEKNLKQTHLGKYFKLNEGFGCAAPLNEADLCKVDVGSPLVCDRGDGQYEVAGIYSWDTKCSTSLPGVLASPDTDWVNQVLAKPIDTLRAESQQQVPVDNVPEDVESKPGFALGYGR